MGDKGARGDPGVVGIKGEIGTSGLTGDQGGVGDAGVKGQIGSKGNKRSFNFFSLHIEKHSLERKIIYQNAPYDFPIFYRRN